MARKALIGTKMKDDSTRVIVAVFALMLIMLGLTAAGVFSQVADYVIVIAKLGAVIVLFTEVGLLGIIAGRGKGLDAVTLIEIVIGSLVAIEVIATLIGFSTGVLAQFSGWILLIFGIVFFIEAFVR